jgi:uncharacterized protein (DUF302 family)
MKAKKLPEQDHALLLEEILNFSGGKSMRTIILAFIFVLVSALSVSAEPGLINVKSSHDVKNTADRLENILKEKGMNVFLRINHTEGARKVGKELRPTELLIFGNPKVGTPLMQCSQTVAIDLPQKALIWQDESGQVWLTYNDPRYLATRHEIDGCKAVLDKIKNALKNFAQAATQP